MEIRLRRSHNYPNSIDSTIMKNISNTAIGARSIEHHPPDGVRGAPLLQQAHRLCRDEVAEGLAGRSRGGGREPPAVWTPDTRMGTRSSAAAIKGLHQFPVPVYKSMWWRRTIVLDLICNARQDFVSEPVNMRWYCFWVFKCYYMNCKTWWYEYYQILLGRNTFVYLNSIIMFTWMLTCDFRKFYLDQRHILTSILE